MYSTSPYSSRNSDYSSRSSYGTGSRYGSGRLGRLDRVSLGSDYKRSPASSSSYSPLNSDSSWSSYSSPRPCVCEHPSPSRTSSYSPRSPRSYLNSASSYSTPGRVTSPGPQSPRSPLYSPGPKSPLSPHYSPLSSPGLSKRFAEFDRRPLSPLMSTPKTLNFDKEIEKLDLSAASVSSATSSQNGYEDNIENTSDSSTASLVKPSPEEKTSSQEVKKSKNRNPSPDDTGKVHHVAKDGRWVGDGFHPVDMVELTADRGYLLWTNARGSIEVKFKYGKTGDDFRCFIDPQYQGVKIYELKGYKKELVIDGKEPVARNRNPHHIRKSPARHRENNFEFRSRDGEVTLLLEACREYNAPKSQAFKFNYVLAL
ncbi:sericin-2-like [Ptychodera flava]|uniref:sericin-2-like n=1 Tax=Ptychodera flava TaxID=63121 RepID=UPI00396A135B